MKKIMKIFPGEALRSQLFLWKRKGLLNIDAEVEDKEVKPKYEKVVRHRGGELLKPLSKKQTDILRWVGEKGEVPCSELNKKFKSPSKAIQCLQSSGLIAISYKEVLRDLSARPELKAYPKPELTLNQETVLKEIVKGVHSKRFSPFLLQ